MKTIIAALSLIVASPVIADVYRCGNTYQSAPCEEASSPINIDTRDTGNGGMRDSERDAINAIHAADVAGAKAKLEAAQRRAEEIDKDGNRKWDRYLESARDRRHNELLDAIRQ